MSFDLCSKDFGGFAPEPNNAPATSRPPLQKGRQMMRPREEEDEPNKSAYKNNVTHRQKINKAKRAVVEKFVRQYDVLIKSTIRKNNDDIYKNLIEFLSPDKKGVSPLNPYEDGNQNKGLTIQGIGGTGFGTGYGGFLQSSDSQVPTCLVITSNESVSSIDTQFNAMCDELKQEIQSINLVLDEKKCTNMKYTIEHIQSRLRDALGSKNVHDLMGEGYADKIENDESGDEVMLHIPQNDSSEEEENENIEEKKKVSISTNHVSSLMQSSFNVNDTIVQQAIPVTDDTIDLNQTDEQIPKTAVNNSMHEKIIRTRGQRIQDKKDERLTSLGIMKNQDAYEQDFSKMINDDQMHSEIFQKETFFGLKHLLTDIDTRKRPVLLIIQNIKAFSPQVLNDLIHHLKLYRGAPHFINFNLMLGVQNNNKEEIHLRVSIQNCTKLVIKTFYFPSMKNIIFEVVYKMLVAQDTLLTFEPTVIQTIIQTINLFGMSVEKFRRILKVLIAEHIYQNQDYFFVHNVPVGLCSKKEFTLLTDKLEKCIRTGFEEFHKEILQEQRTEVQENIIMQISKYVQRRRHWFKAFEVIQELVCKAYITIERENYKKNLEKQYPKVVNIIDRDPEYQKKVKAAQEKQAKEIEDAVEQFQVPQRELQIFKYQFILNYMSQPSTIDKIKFISKLYFTTPSWKDTVFKELLPTLKLKQVKSKIETINNISTRVERESKFIKSEQAIVQAMLTGEYQFQKQLREDQKLNKRIGHGSKSINIKSNARQEALLGGGSRYQREQQQEEVNATLAELGMTGKQSEKLEAAYIKLRPKDDLDYRKMFYAWMDQFHANYLNCEFKKSSKIQQEVFHVCKNDFDNGINPDLSGNVTKTIIDSDLIFEEAQKQMDLEEQLRKELEDQRLADLEGRTYVPPPPPKVAKPAPVKGSTKPSKLDETKHCISGVEDIDSGEEDVKILYELMKFYGRDVNVLEMFSLFKVIMKKKPKDSKANQKYIQPNASQQKDIFITALQELKYMGYISQTRQSTYIFKKNFFGKVKHNKQVVRTEEQIQKEADEISRQFGPIVANK